MNRKIVFFLFACFLSLMLVSCGPSKEKVEQAQAKYVQLIDKHNQAVEIHKNIDDASLDEALLKLKEKVAEVETYNLADMQDEEIDLLIQIMDALIKSYDGYLDTLSGIWGAEEAAERIPVFITLKNNTEISFSSLKLYEEGDSGIHVNVLENLEPLTPGQSLTGLVIQRDVNNTPWILALVDLEGREYQIVIHGEEYGESVSLDMVYDEGGQGLTLLSMAVS